jgi:phage baseplate assembly protein gpV
MQDGIFSSLKTAPDAGYAYDTTSTNLAIKDGSWYDYNSASHAFIPKAGKVFFFRTADGLHYAKLQLLSVDYLPFTGQVPLQLAYKFQYTYQPNGTKIF